MKPLNFSRFNSSITIVATAAFALALASNLARAATGTWTGISGNWSNTTDPG